MTESLLTRRKSLMAVGGLCAAQLSTSLTAQELIGEAPGRIAPVGELLNVFEIQAMAQRKLAGNVYAAISGSDRAALERITFRPRLLVNVSKLDLSLTLFGSKLFTPIIAGPVWRQAEFHPEAELAMARGTAASSTLMVVSQQASKPLPQIVEAAGQSPLWYQAYIDADPNVTAKACREAAQLGCKVIMLTVGVPYQTASAGSRLQPTGNLQSAWAAIDRIRQAVTVPLILKGVLNPEEASAAAEKGIQGVVVSNHGGLFTSGFADPTEMLPAVAQAVGGKIPVLVDGSFRRGTDIMKALALGAQGVLVARPAVWGLAAYGAEGVQTVFEMLQTELARTMAMCGKATLSSIDNTIIKVHRR